MSIRCPNCVYMIPDCPDDGIDTWIVHSDKLNVWGLDTAKDGFTYAGGKRLWGKDTCPPDKGYLMDKDSVEEMCQLCKNNWNCIICQQLGKENCINCNEEK